MGYTHYFGFRRPKGKTAAQLETAYKKALLECQKVLKSYQRTAESQDRLSGYSVHTPLGKYGGLLVNGKKENGHEDLALREHFAQNDGGFCKTERKPYDTAVVACLAILKYRLGDAFSVGSDGDAQDFEQGTQLACVVLNRKIKNPIAGKQVRDEAL